MQEKEQKGFTLIEMLIVMGIIAVLAGIVLIAVNPGRQFKQAHDTQRESNINAILNAVGQNIAENKGVFTCLTGSLPTEDTVMAKTGGYDIRPCITPLYISEIPVDPTTGSNTCQDAQAGDCAASGAYDTKYMVKQDAGSGRVTVSAMGEIKNSISITR